MEQGPTYHWLRLAGHLKMTVDECQEKTNAWDFLLWNTKFDHGDWKYHTKQDYLLARIAYEVCSLKVAMAGKEGTRVPEFKTFLEYMGKPPVDLETLEALKDQDYENPEGVEGIEIGEEVLDEKWQAVNEEAKSEWMAVAAAFASMGVEVQMSGGTMEE